MTQRPRIAIGLSGGVDSAVSAALLAKQGVSVVGVFLESWSPEFAPSQCTQVADRRDAARVAAHLGIPFQVLPCADVYRQRVFEYFLENLRRGLTPNPDAWCNAEIKFGVFSQVALEAGFDGVATGHYARVDTQGRLFRGQDAEKDQSYFLARVSPTVLRRVQFPIGGLTKTHVRALAKKFRLPVAHKPDSQGLCFVGKISLPEFLQNHVALQAGPVRTTTGAVVGQHQGLATLTIGQRHGFRTALGAPAYVVAKDVATNTAVVSSRLADLAQSALTVTDVVWFDASVPLAATTVQLRYRHPAVAVHAAHQTGEKWRIELASPDVPVPGQIAAFYKGDQLVASGILL